MPKQNRVTPLGEIIATPERGLFMGNRGRLHDAAGRIERQWEGKRWIICLLNFGGRKRTVMAPGQYTELFFLDEATALAAGHRPCFECRRARFTAYSEAYQRGNRTTSGKISATLIDNQLHSERVAANRSEQTFEAQLGELPCGVFVTAVELGTQPHLFFGERLLEWSAGGYRLSGKSAIQGAVSVLTPRSTVETIRAGYVPEVHPTALQLIEESSEAP